MLWENMPLPKTGDDLFELPLPSVSPAIRRFTDNNSKISFMTSIGLSRVSDDEKRGRYMEFLHLYLHRKTFFEMASKFDLNSFCFD